MKPKPALLLPVLLLPSLLPAGPKSRAISSRSLIPKEHPVRKVLVLPAQIQLTKSSIKGKLGMTAMSEPFAARITVLVGQSLRKRRIEVLPDPFTEEKLDRDEQLRESLTRLQGRYDALSTQLHTKPNDVRKSRYSLGDEVATLRPAAGADAIAFIRGSGTATTRGKAALSMFAGGELPNTIQTIVSFADASSGGILAYVEVFTVGDFVNQPERTLEKPLGKLLKKIPFIPK